MYHDPNPSDNNPVARAARALARRDATQQREPQG